MSDIVEQYLATWNADGAEREALLAEHWSPDVHVRRPAGRGQRHGRPSAPWSTRSRPSSRASSSAGSRRPTRTTVSSASRGVSAPRARSRS